MGSSRETHAGLRARLDQRRDDPGLAGVPGELFAVADLVDRDPPLRSALSDGGQPVQARSGLVDALFGARLSRLAVGVLRDLVSQRWSSPAELVEALEGLAAQAAFLVAQKDGNLDQVQDHMFAFAQAVSGSAELQMALTNPAAGAQVKASLVESLLQDRAGPVATEVLAYAMSHLRGRRADSVVEGLLSLAAEQQGRSVAEVRVARPLDADQERRLVAALSKLQGRDVRLNVAVDPRVIGGISVRIAGEVMDATMATRIEQARRMLVGQPR
ncbi:MAG: F0F1 ATP synthase subunit delta [Candidatus Nanopelagicales bacterium]